MKNLWIRPLKLLAILMAVTVAAGFGQEAFAQAANGQPNGVQTLGDMTNSIYDSLISLQFFLSLLSYILGVFFTITGLQQLRNYIDDPGRNPAQASLLRLGAAAFFIFAPTAANMLTKSLGAGNVGSNTNLLDTAGDSAVSSAADVANAGQGLDGAILRFVTDFGGPFLDNLLPIFAYVAGLILMLVGLKRLALANGDGPQAPGGMGTIGTFLVAAGLMAFGYVMYAMQGSIFGTTHLYTNQNFTGTGSGVDAALQDRAQKTLWGIFIFLRIVGYISVLRGLFMLRAVAEGGQASMMAVGTHFVAGSMLANAGAFVDVIQHTFLGDDANFVFDAI